MSLNQLLNNKKYDLKYVAALTIIPILGIFGTLGYSLQFGIIWQEPILLFVLWIITGLSITVGYHRLFAHRSFSAHPILNWILAIFGAAALENSALKWCSDHRRHHKHLDTDQDPYSITKGFFHAHMGWILENKPSPIENVKDLEENPALKFQNKYYVPLFIIFGLLLPISLGFIWGRPLGALFWGVLLRITLVHHFTYFINSMCHYVGTKPYDSKCTSRDSWYMALLTFGEGFHNYHHKFQWDYRNGVRWFHFDPSKWLIWFFSKIGMANGLKKASKMQILKACSNNQWNQIYLYLNKMPNKLTHTYSEKLNFIKESTQSLEKSWKMINKEIDKIISNKKMRFQTKKLFREKKLLQLEYVSHLRSLSLILITLQNIHY